MIYSCSPAQDLLDLWKSNIMGTVPTELGLLTNLGKLVVRDLHSCGDNVTALTLSLLHNCGRSVSGFRGNEVEWCNSVGGRITESTE